jgi:polysaccharide export outer membrane protein
MRKRTLLPLAGLLTLTACIEGHRLGETNEPMAVVRQDSLPAPTGADLVAATTPYRIGPSDKLKIDVFGVEDLSGEFQTDASAGLSMPLIGYVDAASKTPDELAAVITAKLRRFVKDPQVTVNLKETTSQVFTVDGQVTQPGSYPVVGNMSLMRAVATAKGVGEFARMVDVVIFRTVDGHALAGLYNLAAIRRGLYADPKIYANDVIIVGDSTARRLFNQFIQVSPLFTTPLILALEHH